MANDLMKVSEHPESRLLRRHTDPSSSRPVPCPDTALTRFPTSAAVPSLYVPAWEQLLRTVVLSHVERHLSYSSSVCLAFCGWTLPFLNPSHFVAANREGLSERERLVLAGPSCIYIFVFTSSFCFVFFSFLTLFQSLGQTCLGRVTQ